MLTKEGMLVEDVKIQIGNRSYHNLSHYSPNAKLTRPSIYGAFNSFTPDFFEYDESGEPVIAKFMPAFAGVGRATRRVRIPISKLREEVSELERALCKSLEDESNVRTFGEGSIQLRVNEQAERIRELIKQRNDYLHFYLDMPKELEQHYSGLKDLVLTK